MTQPEQKLHLVMDDSNPPYEEGEYTRTLDDDLSLLDIVKKYGLELKTGCHLDKLAKAIEAGQIPVPPAT